MIREIDIKDRENIDEMQFELQKYFSEIDRTHESLPYKDMDDAHRYIQKMLDDVKNMNGKVFVSEEDGQVIGFIQGVIIEHKKGDDEIYDLSRKPSKDGWIGLLFVKLEFRGIWHRTRIIRQNERLFHNPGVYQYQVIGFIRQY